MKKVPIIKQHDEKDCGAACLSMVLEYYGRKLPMSVLREAIQVDQYGASICGLMEGAERYGLEAQALEGEALSVWDALIQRDVSMPAILRILSQNTYEHYVVVVGMKAGKLLLCDPDKGRRSMDQAEFEACFLGQLVLFKKGENFRAENLRQGRFHRFIKLVLVQKKLVALIGLLSLGVTGVGLSGAFLFQFLIDNVLSDLDMSSARLKLASFSRLAVALSLLYLFKLAVQLLRGKLLTKMSRSIDLPLILGYYNHVVEMPISFFEKRSTGEIISRFQDASRIRDAISGTTLTLMIDVILVLVCGMVLFHISVPLFSVAMCIFLLYMLITALYVKPLAQINREQMEQNARFNSYIKETVDGMETIKATQSEEHVKEKSRDLFCRFLSQSLRGGMTTLSKDALIDCVTGIGTLVLLWVGTLCVLDGSLTIGSLLTFHSLLAYFLSPVQNLVELQSTLQSALVAADRLNDVLELEPEANGRLCPGSALKMVSLDAVNFRYGARKLALKDVSFSASKGQQIALVGESGCGKSTVAKLLMGLYHPESGSIRFNGVAGEDVDLNWLRSQIAYVQQTTCLFSDTIRANLLLGLPEEKRPTEDELKQVIEDCCCQFIWEMPLGIDSLLEENGSNLSGGQKQRLALARALLRKPRLLILDEATSALDSVTEEHIQRTLTQQYPEMIVVLVAHRLSTVRQCSQILVMDQGQVVEKGSHMQLLSQNSYYARLWNSQQSNAA